MKKLAYVLLFTAMTAISWGAYGALLNMGIAKMQGSHWLPFLFVGVAYFLIGVLVTSGILIWRGEQGNWNAGGVIWSFLAGVVTAFGALCLILAVANHGNPIYVMPLVFGCAPVVNTLLTMWMSKTHRETGPFFYAGLIVVIAGAVTVLYCKPKVITPAIPTATAQAPTTSAPADSTSGTTPATAIATPPAPATPPATTAPPVNFLVVLTFVALTAICWGFYGPLLHKGQTKMNGSRMRPFICVGAAYAVVAIAGPLILWTAQGDKGQISAPGVMWSLAGGTAGALGSLGVILAFTFGGKPIYVMPLVFGFAPVVSTFIAIATTNNLEPVSPFFLAGLIVVVAGAVSVLIFAPRGQPHAVAAVPPAKAPTPAPEPAKS